MLDYEFINLLARRDLYRPGKVPCDLTAEVDLVGEDAPSAPAPAPAPLPFHGQFEEIVEEEVDDIDLFGGAPYSDEEEEETIDLFEGLDDDEGGVEVVVRENVQGGGGESEEDEEQSLDLFGDEDEDDAIVVVDEDTPMAVDGGRAQPAAQARPRGPIRAGPQEAAGPLARPGAAGGPNDSDVFWAVANPQGLRKIGLRYKDGRVAVIHIRLVFKSVGAKITVTGRSVTIDPKVDPEGCRRVARELAEEHDLLVIKEAAALKATPQDLTKLLNHHLGWHSDRVAAALTKLETDAGRERDSTPQRKRDSRGRFSSVPAAERGEGPPRAQSAQGAGAGVGVGAGGVASAAGAGTEARRGTETTVGVTCTVGGRSGHSVQYKVNRKAPHGQRLARSMPKGSTLVDAAIEHDLMMLERLPSEFGFTRQGVRDLVLNVDLGVHKDERVLKLLEGTQPKPAAELEHFRQQQASARERARKRWRRERQGQAEGSASSSSSSEAEEWEGESEEGEGEGGSSDSKESEEADQALLRRMQREAAGLRPRAGSPPTAPLPKPPAPVSGGEKKEGAAADMIGLHRKRGGTGWTFMRIFRHPETGDRIRILPDAGLPSTLTKREAAVQHDLSMLRVLGRWISRQEVRNRKLHYDLGTHDDARVAELLVGTVPPLPEVLQRIKALPMAAALPPRQTEQGLDTESEGQDDRRRAEGGAGPGPRDRGPTLGAGQGAGGAPRALPPPATPGPGLPGRQRTIGVAKCKTAASGLKFLRKITVTGLRGERKEVMIQKFTFPAGTSRRMAAILGDRLMIKELRKLGMSAQEIRDRRLNFDLGVHEDPEVAQMLAGTQPPNMDFKMKGRLGYLDSDSEGEGLGDDEEKKPEAGGPGGKRKGRGRGRPAKRPKAEQPIREDEEEEKKVDAMFGPEHYLAALVKPDEHGGDEVKIEEEKVLARWAEEGKPPSRERDGAGAGRDAPSAASNGRGVRDPTAAANEALPPIPGPQGKGGFLLVHWMRESPANAKKVTSFLSQVLWRARDAPAACYPVDGVPYEQLRDAVGSVRYQLIKGTLATEVVEDLVDFASVVLQEFPQYHAAPPGEDLFRQLLSDVYNVLDLHGLLGTTP